MRTIECMRFRATPYPKAGPHGSRMRVSPVFCMVRCHGFMNRRELLKGIGVLLGGSVSPAVVAAVLADDGRQTTGGSWQPQTLSADQDHLVTAIAEAIIPATDTPGATIARVNEFIDLLLSKWLDREGVRRFLDGLEEFDSRTRAVAGRSFIDLALDQQLALLEPLDREAIEVRNAAREAGSEHAEDLPFFGMMKEMTLVGYYTSEIGMTQELLYPEITSTYSGCVPFDEIGRSWA